MDIQYQTPLPQNPRRIFVSTLTYRHHEIAERQVHDWSLWVVEPRWIDQERRKSGGCGETTEDGPNRQPQLHKLSILSCEER